MATPSNPTERIPNAARKKLLAPSPTTTRGAPTVLGLHPKENKIIYCSGKLVIVRNLDDPTDTFVYKGHNEPTTVAKFAPNGYWIASGDISGHVRVWSYDHPEHTLKIEVPVFAGEIKDLEWDPDSKRIVAVGDGRSLMARVFMWDTGNNLGEIVGHQKRILSVDYKPTRPFRIMTASEDFNVCVYEGPPFKFKQNNNSSHTNFVNCVRYAPNGEWVISVGSDKLMVLYDGKTGDVVGTFPVVHTASIYSVAWSPDSTQVLTSSADKTVILWDVATKTPVQTFKFNSSQVLDMQVAVAWKNDFLLSLSLSGDLNYLDRNDPTRPKRVVQAHQVSILGLAVEPSRDFLLTGSYDGVLSQWHAHVATRVSGKAAHTGKITGIAANDTTIASVGWDDHVRFSNGREFIASVPLGAQPNGVAVASTGTLVGVSTNKGIKLLRDQLLVYETREFAWTPTCIAVSPQGDLIAVGSQEDKKIYLFNVVNNGSQLQEAGEIVGHLGALTCLAFSPDGIQLAAGDAYREVRVWDIASRSAVVQGMWVFHSTRVTSVAWSPSGHFIASGSLDEHIYIWNVQSPQKKTLLDYAHKDGVTGVCFTAEDQLVSIGNDACVAYWHV